MTKLLASGFLCFLLTTMPSAAADLSVRVTDPRDAAIPGATVTLISRDGERRTLTAGSDGTVRFTELKEGGYFVRGAAAGFEISASRAIGLNGENHLETTLSLGLAQVRSSVVVTASGTMQSTDEVSKALTIVEGETINLRAGKSMAEALDEVPGLRVQQLGGPGSTTFFKIRGLRNADTAVLVDGLRLRDAAGVQADASGVLQDLVVTNTSRIEILRGAGSSLYGTDATGGVVNIVTDDGGGRTRGSILADGGSLGMARGLARIAGAFGQDRAQFSLGVTHWNVTRGVDHNSPARNTSGQGQISYRLSPIASFSGRIYAGDSFGFLRLSPRGVGILPPVGIVDAVPLSLAEEHRYEAGAPVAQLSLDGATFLPATYNSDSTRAGRFFTGALRFNVHPTDRIGLTAQYQNLTTTRNYGDGPAGPGFQPAAASLSRFDGRIQTANARLDARLGRFQQFDAGYEFENENFQNGSIPPPPVARSFVDVTQRSHSIFAQDQIRLMDGRFQFAAAYRAQFFSLNQPSFEPASGAPFAGRNFGAPPTAETGDVSTSYTFRRSATKFRAHAGRGYRAPSLYERFGTFYAGGSSYSLFGDPRLRPDRSSSIDGGIDQSLWNARIQVSATYFYTRLNEVVAFDSSGAVNPVTDPLGRSGGYLNTGGGIARGVEFSSSFAATRSAQLTGAYTYTDARQRIPLVAGVWRAYEAPEHQYSFSVTQRFSSQLTGFFVLAGSSDYLGSVSGRAFRFGGLARARVGISYRRPLSEFRAVRFYVKADNAFDQTYFDNGFRTPGATITIGTQFEF